MEEQHDIRALRPNTWPPGCYGGSAPATLLRRLGYAPPRARDARRQQRNLRAGTTDARTQRPDAPPQQADARKRLVLSPARQRNRSDPRARPASTPARCAATAGRPAATATRSAATATRHRFRPDRRESSKIEPTLPAGHTVLIQGPSNKTPGRREIRKKVPTIRGVVRTCCRDLLRRERITSGL